MFNVRNSLVSGCILLVCPSFSVSWGMWSSQRLAKRFRKLFRFKGLGFIIQGMRWSGVRTRYFWLIRCSRSLALFVSLTPARVSGLGRLSGGKMAVEIIVTVTTATAATAGNHLCCVCVCVCGCMQVRDCLCVCCVLPRVLLLVISVCALVLLLGMALFNCTAGRRQWKWVTDRWVVAGFHWPANATVAPTQHSHLYSAVSPLPQLKKMAQLNATLDLSMLPAVVIVTIAVAVADAIVIAADRWRWQSTNWPSIRLTDHDPQSGEPVSEAAKWTLLSGVLSRTWSWYWNWNWGLVAGMTPCRWPYIFLVSLAFCCSSECGSHFSAGGSLSFVSLS